MLVRKCHTSLPNWQTNILLLCCCQCELNEDMLEFLKLTYFPGLNQIVPKIIFLNGRLAVLCRKHRRSWGLIDPHAVSQISTLYDPCLTRKISGFHICFWCDNAKSALFSLKKMINNLEKIISWFRVLPIWMIMSKPIISPLLMHQKFDFICLERKRIVFCFIKTSQHVFHCPMVNKWNI